MRGLIIMGLGVLLIGGGAIIIARFLMAGRAHTPANPTTTPAEVPPGGTLNKPNLSSEAARPTGAKPPTAPLMTRSAVRNVLPPLGVK